VYSLLDIHYSELNSKANTQPLRLFRCFVNLFAVGLQQTLYNKFAGPKIYYTPYRWHVEQMNEVKFGRNALRRCDICVNAAAAAAAARLSR